MKRICSAKGRRPHRTHFTSTKACTRAIQNQQSKAEEASCAGAMECDHGECRFGAMGARNREGDGTQEVETVNAACG
jgi:hypothetical protein